MKLNLTPEQIKEITDRIMDFDNWQWCNCSECKCDPRSHGVETHRTLENLVAEVLKDDE